MSNGTAAFLFLVFSAALGVLAILSVDNGAYIEAILYSFMSGLVFMLASKFCHDWLLEDIRKAFSKEGVNQ